MLSWIPHLVFFSLPPHIIWSTMGMVILDWQLCFSIIKSRQHADAQILGQFVAKENPGFSGAKELLDDLWVQISHKPTNFQSFFLVKLPSQQLLIVWKIFRLICHWLKEHSMSWRPYTPMNFHQFPRHSK
ncbi:hypothetical protein N7494_010973 [Penicillium frequentans]|uniref:Uncharacterized protein n=1 Tax=Penicillium frequentans TaxID=3151616 RepID=A0AAD6CIT4_9EURO|nr:hypothetical protein N7494_010973 [Penicillium glabrum]